MNVKREDVSVKIKNLVSGEVMECGGNGPVSLRMNENGSYTCEYNMVEAGEYEIEVSIQGKKIRDMPRIVKIGEGSGVERKPVSATNTLVYGKGVEEKGNVVGQGEIGFEIEGRDEDGVLVPLTESALSVFVCGPQGSLLLEW